jgi:hypothetical protein
MPGKSGLVARGQNPVDGKAIIEYITYPIICHFKHYVVVFNRNGIFHLKRPDSLIHSYFKNTAIQRKIKNNPYFIIMFISSSGAPLTIKGSSTFGGAK